MKDPTTSTRLLIVDDHLIIRQGLKMFLADRPDLKVVAEARDGHEAVRLTAEHAPDVVLMDVNLPNLDGIEATRQICGAGGCRPGGGDVKGGGRGPRVIALSAYGDRRSVSGVLDAGAAGYVLKTDSMDDLVTAIDAVLAGNVYLSPAIAGVVVDDFVQGRHAGSRNDAGAAARLSDRERQVLRRIAQGLATKEVARDLGVSVKTVETHRRNLMEKLDRHSVAGLTHFAVSEGLVALDDAAPNPARPSAV
jgi:DNA-binding NarL/FixJ family response regulator